MDSGRGGLRSIIYTPRSGGHSGWWSFLIKSLYRSRRIVASAKQGYSVKNRDQWLVKLPASNNTPWPNICNTFEMPEKGRQSNCGITPFFRNLFQIIFFRYRLAPNFRQILLFEGHKNGITGRICDLLRLVSNWLLSLWAL